MDTKKLTKVVIDNLCAHPYLWALLICLLIDPFFLGAAEHNKAMWSFAGGSVLVLGAYLFADREKYLPQLNSLLIMGVGFFLKLYYVLVTSIYTRQYDVSPFGENGVFGIWSGHAFYIDYLMKYWSLPDFNIRLFGQMTHPPLHHFIGAVWIYISEHLFLFGHDPSRESLQMLTLFYSMCIVISSYKILRHFHLEGWKLYLPLLLISFQPVFIRFAALINNDVLCVALIMAAVVSALQWFEKKKLRDLIVMALCTGCALMTKISAIMFLGPLFLLFIFALIEERRLWKHVVIFCLLCLPLGFWFSLRSYLKFDIPLLYVQKMPPSDDSYNGDKSYVDNLCSLSPSPLKYPFLQIKHRTESGINDRNPLIVALKTSLFGEGINTKTFANHGNFAKGGIVLSAKILFVVNLFINFIALVTMILLVAKNKHDKVYLEKLLFLISFYLVMWLGIYKQYYDQLFISSANFRYIAPTATITALFIGLLLKNTKSKVVTNIVKVTTLLFVITTSAIYLSIIN